MKISQRDTSKDGLATILRSLPVPHRGGDKSLSYISPTQVQLGEGRDPVHVGLIVSVRRLPPLPYYCQVRPCLVTVSHLSHDTGNVYADPSLQFLRTRTCVPQGEPHLSELHQLEAIVQVSPLSRRHAS